MGTLSLECPLCCNEKFTSFHSLKYHLLRIVDNLNCSSCSKKFTNVRELIDHLDLECCGSKEGKSGIKSEVLDDVEECLEKSILAKALLKKRTDDEEDMEEEEAIVSIGEVEEEEDVESEAEDVDKEQNQLYECSTCEVQFTSVEEHIREFHAGTEVVLQVSDLLKTKYGQQRMRTVFF